MLRHPPPLYGQGCQAGGPEPGIRVQVPLSGMPEGPAAPAEAAGGHPGPEGRQTGNDALKVRKNT